MAKPLDGAISSDQEVENIEAFRPAVGHESCARTTLLGDDLGCLFRVPAMTSHMRNTLRPGSRGDSEQAVSRTSGQRTSGATDMHHPVPRDAIESQLG
jgi:hypothetical protein